jgi:acyl carrier protein
MSTKEKIRAYILENFLFTTDPTQLSDDDSFLGRGILDSTGMMEVIYFLEDQYQVKVEDEEMVPENLDSVTKIERYVARKLGQVETA